MWAKILREILSSGQKTEKRDAELESRRNSEEERAGEGGPLILCVNQHKSGAWPRAAYAQGKPKSSAAKALTTDLTMEPHKQKTRQHL